MTERPTVDHPNKLVSMLWVVPALGMLWPPLVFLWSIDQGLWSEDVLGALFITFGIGFVFLLIMAILKSTGVIDLKHRSVRLALALGFIDGVGSILFSMLIVGYSAH